MEKENIISYLQKILFATYIVHAIIVILHQCITGPTISLISVLITDGGNFGRNWEADKCHCDAWKTLKTDQTLHTVIYWFGADIEL